MSRISTFDSNERLINKLKQTIDSKHKYKYSFTDFLTSLLPIQCFYGKTHWKSYLCWCKRYDRYWNGSYKYRQSLDVVEFMNHLQSLKLLVKSTLTENQLKVNKFGEFNSISSPPVSLNRVDYAQNGPDLVHKTFSDELSKTDMIIIENLVSNLEDNVNIHNMATNESNTSGLEIMNSHKKMFYQS